VQVERETEPRMALASGLFDQAEAYWNAALALQKANLQFDFSLLPVLNLYSHAIALYLKCFLRIHGHPLEELEGKFKNDFRRMKKRAEAYGLRFAGTDKSAIEYYIHTPAAVRLKYSATPYYAAPTVEDLNGLCDTLRKRIAAEVERTP
jgi:hypothetical protein